MARPVIWVGSTREDLRTFPEEVQDEVGYRLWQAQLGQTSPRVKPLKGFGGAGVLEIVADRDGDTYRAVYTVRFREAVYVLHCFQKKSHHGIKTDHRDIELIRRRLREAEEHYRAWMREGGGEAR